MSPEPRSWAAAASGPDAPLGQQPAALSRDFAERFAHEWIAAWNARDLERIVAHVDDDFEALSAPAAGPAGGSGAALRGKAAARALWHKALRSLPPPRFELLGVFVGARGLAIHYRDQLGRLAVEVLDLGPRGRIVRAWAHHAGPMRR